MKVTGRYIDRYRKVHAERKYGGGDCGRVFDWAAKVCKQTGAESFLDYGCGQSDLRNFIKKNKSTGVSISRGFDPAIPGIDELPRCRFDVVMCSDVVEHVPEDELDCLLANLKSLSRYPHRVMIVACCRPALNTFEDGENMHCTVKPVSWWIDKVREHFPDTRLAARWPRKRYLITTFDHRGL